MADFRKMSLVLAVLALVAIAVPAQAQVQCTVQAGQNVPTLRDGGITELVGDTLLVCNGGTAGAGTVSTASILATMTNAPVTARITGTTNTNGTLLASVWLKVTGYDAGGVATDTYTQGYLQPAGLAPAPNAVLFPSVAIPGGTQTKLRIINIRVQAPAAISGFGTTPVTESLSANAQVGQSITITNPFNIVVGQVSPSLKFSATDCKNNALSSLSFQQCNSHGQASSDEYAVDAVVKFTELTTAAFKTLGQEQGAPGAAGAPDAVDTGTRLMVKFTNIPAGVKIIVSNTDIASTTFGAFTIHAMLDDNANPGPLSSSNANVGNGTTPSGLTATGTGCTPATEGFTTLTPYTEADGSKSAIAVYEIVTPGDLSNNDSLSFDVVIQYTANTTNGSPALTGSTPMAVSGEFAPISTVTAADKTSPIPRFSDRPVAGPTASIIACSTTLLFPFVANIATFDTGIAVVNTSMDPLGTGTQEGPCTFSYFGGTNPPKAQTTTANVKAGQLIAFSIGQGGVPGDPNPITPGTFEGYVFAQCQFQFAHGFAFISDSNQPSIGNGSYLALVLPDPNNRTPTEALNQ